MSTIIYTKIKGTTYCYRSESYWDKESKTPKSKRTLIGKIDPETGEIVPTAGRGRKPKAAVLETEGHEVRNTVENHADKTSGADPESTDPAAMYKECHRELLQTQAALAIAESRISALTAEKDSIARQLERILHQLKN